MTEDLRGDEPTRLVLPVPELTDRLPGAAVTLVFPFLPARSVDDGVLSELEVFFAALVPFAYVLGDPVRFPSGAAYLPPQPAATIRRLAHDLRRAFPEVVAPAAPLRSVTPHLVLPPEVELITPVEVHAREALLVVEGVSGTRVLARFRFATSAA